MFGRACWYSRGGGGRGGRSGRCQPLRAGPGTLPSLPPSCRPGVASRALRRAHLLHEASQAPPGLHLGTLWPPGTCLPALLAQSESCESSSPWPSSCPPFLPAPAQHTLPFLVLCLTTLAHSLQPKVKALTALRPQGPSGVIPNYLSGLPSFQPP